MTPAATATRMSTKIRASIGHSMARRDIHLTLVTCGVDGEGRAIISSTEDRVKVRNLRRDPRASMCVMSDRFFGGGVQVHGSASIVSLPEAMEPLIDDFRRGRRQGAPRLGRVPAGHGRSIASSSGSTSNKPVLPESDRQCGRGYAAGGRVKPATHLLTQQRATSEPPR